MSAIQSAIKSKHTKGFETYNAMTRRSLESIVAKIIASDAHEVLQEMVDCGYDGRHQLGNALIREANCCVNVLAHSGANLTHARCMTNGETWKKGTQLGASKNCCNYVLTLVHDGVSLEDALHQMETTFGLRAAQWSISNMDFNQACAISHCTGEYLLMHCKTIILREAVFLAAFLLSVPALERLLADGHRINDRRPATTYGFKTIARPHTVLFLMVKGDDTERIRRVPFIQCALDHGADIDYICIPDNKTRRSIRNIIECSSVLRRELTLPDKM